MSRKERIHIPGAVYHVILRGNDRQDNFADDKDRFRFYEILNIARQRFTHKCQDIGYPSLTLKSVRTSVTRPLDY